MRIDVGDDEAVVAQRAAALIAQTINAAVAARGRACLAFSGGRSPWPMMRALADADVRWRHVHVFQTDERVAPVDDPARTLPQLRDAFLSHVPIPADHVHPMPVDDSDVDAAAQRYATILERLAGTPCVLDLVHLGLGDDGHTASLIPSDEALNVSTADVTLSGPYQGHRRMTLTFPLLNRAKAVLWLVTGQGKAGILRRLWDGDYEIPAGRVRRDRAVIVTDRAAAQRITKDVGESHGQKLKDGRGKGPYRILTVDVGGAHVKVMSNAQLEKREFESGPKLTAKVMVAKVKRITGDWTYDVVSIGYPGPAVHGYPLAEPVNLGDGWVGFDFEEAFGLPVKLVNDAVMQALGSYEGGRMLFLGLGTGLGSAMIIDGIVEPMEIGHLPYKNGKTFEDYLGRNGMERLGKKKWRAEVEAAVKHLKAALMPDYIVLGGGNVKKLKTLPPDTRAGDNENAFAGGFQLWNDSVTRSFSGRAPSFCADPEINRGSGPIA